jgi:putative membrane protein
MVDPVLDRNGWRGPLRLLFNPLIAGLLYTLIISIWHAPSAYDWALQNKTVHVIEHLMFFGAGLLYWWPMLSPSRAFPPLPYGVRMIYLFGVLIAMTPVFAYITFSRDILYPTYEYAPRLIADFTASEDQLLAGVSMKLVGLVVALAAFGVCFFKWAAASDKKKDRSMTGLRQK